YRTNAVVALSVDGQVILPLRALPLRTANGVLQGIYHSSLAHDDCRNSLSKKASVATWQRRELALCQRGSAYGLPGASRLARVLAYRREGCMGREIAVGLWRQLCLGGHAGAGAPVCGGLRRPACRTVQTHNHFKPCGSGTWLTGVKTWLTSIYSEFPLI